MTDTAPSADTTGATAATDPASAALPLVYSCSACQLHLRLAVRHLLHAFGPGLLLDFHAQLEQFSLDRSSDPVTSDNVLIRAQKHNGLVLELKLDLSGKLHARGTRAGDDNVRGLANALGGAVKRRDELLIGVGCLPGHTGIGGPGACSQDKVIVSDGAGSSTRCHVDCFGALVHIRSLALDEFGAADRILLQAGLNWLQDVLILNDARYYSSHRGRVPVKVAVLRSVSTNKDP